jgi:hypothetical protein
MGAGYGPNIIIDGLVLHLDAENRRSYSGNGSVWYDLNKKRYNSNLLNTTFGVGPFANTSFLRFNGTTSYGYGGDTSVVNGNYTISVWFKTTGVPSYNDAAGAFLFCQSNNFYHGIALTHSWTSQRITHGSRINDGMVTADGSAPNNTIINAVATWDGATQKIYINGVLSASRSYTLAPYVVSPVYQVGRWGYSGYERYYNGHIYDVALYNRALNDSEIFKNYNRLKHKIENYDNGLNFLSENRVLYLDAALSQSYPLAGTTWTDLSGNSNGTLTNGPTFTFDADGAINFDGSNDYVNIPYVGSFPSGNSERTMEIVLYPTSTSQKEAWGIGNNSSSGSRMGVWLDGSYIGIEVLNAGVRTSNWAGINNWTHFVATFPAGSTTTSQIKLYINGVEQTANLIGTNYTINTATTANVLGTVPAAIGAHPYAGKIGMVKLYNKALNSDEIYKLFSMIRGRFGL